MATKQLTVATYLRKFAHNTVVDHKAVNDMVILFTKPSQQLLLNPKHVLLKMRSDAYSNIMVLAFQKQIRNIFVCIALYDDNVWRHHLTAADEERYIETTELKRAYILFQRAIVPLPTIQGSPVNTPTTCFFYLRRHQTHNHALFGSSGPSLEVAQTNLKKKLEPIHVQQINKMCRVDSPYNKFLSLIYHKDDDRMIESIMIYMHVPTTGDVKEKLKEEALTILRNFMFYDYYFADETSKHGFIQTDPPETYTFVRNSSNEWSIEGMPSLPLCFVRAGTAFINQVAPGYEPDMIVLKHSDVIAKLAQKK